MKRTTIHIFAALALLLGLASCTQDEAGFLPEGAEGTPIVFTATGLNPAATATAGTRAPADGNWTGVQSVAVLMDGTVKTYNVTPSTADPTSATLTSTDPYYWTNHNDITVTAWWPYTAGETTPPAVKVKANQSTQKDFEGSDLIVADGQTVTYGSPTLRFTHRTARVTIVLTDYTEGLASVKLTGLSTEGDNPDIIVPYDKGSNTYTAIVAPQSVAAGTTFITCTFNNGKTIDYKMKNAIKEILGFDYFLPTHQGRAAENVLYSTIIKEGDVLPGNSHFDTTKGHIEFRKALAIDCTIDEAADTQLEIPFKGNMDPTKLEEVLKKYPKEKIPAVVLTVTNNTAGGQPVSMQNIREVSALCKKYGVNLQIDSARFAENAYFIKTREKGYENKSIKEIVKEMFSYADIMTMSSKKDAIVNMGGFVAFKSEELWKKCQMFCIMNEGFITYGGMSGRDMNALAQGLDEGTEFEYLETRIKQVEYLGAKLDEYGIPYQRPAGGHAIFVDAKKVLTHVPKEEFIAQTLGVELYLEAGIRGVEIGSILADRDPVTRENRYPRLELLRLAIPRRTYTNNHMDVIAAALKYVYDRRESITRGYVITKEFPIMRHFTVELEKAK